jgi:hypothetical protein
VDLRPQARDHHDRGRAAVPDRLRLRLRSHEGDYRGRAGIRTRRLSQHALRSGRGADERRLLRLRIRRHLSRQRLVVRRIRRRFRRGLRTGAANSRRGCHRAHRARARRRLRRHAFHELELVGGQHHRRRSDGHRRQRRLQRREQVGAGRRQQPGRRHRLEARPTGGAMACIAPSISRLPGRPLPSPSRPTRPRPTRGLASSWAPQPARCGSTPSA